MCVTDRPWRKCLLFLQVIHAIQNNLTFALAEENFALNRPVHASSTCGANGNPELFCAYRAPCSQNAGVCNTTCGAGGTLPLSIDVLAAGERHGQVN